MAVIEILYQDDRLAVCVKPVGVLSTDEPGGMPALLREALGDPAAPVRTVHRLDRVVGGLMVLARTRRAAAELGEQITARRFEKEYLAAVHGAPPEDAGRMRDLLLRDRSARRTYVVDTPREGAREAVLDYRTLGYARGLSLVRIRLVTGRTHQIRVQFASRGLPLAGERKYAGTPEEEGTPALWSFRLAFDHPRSGERMDFFLPPPEAWPWSLFDRGCFAE